MKAPARSQTTILAMLVITLTAIAFFAGGASATVRQQGSPPPPPPACDQAAPPCLQDPQNVRMPDGQVIPLQQFHAHQQGGQQGGGQQGGGQQGGGDGPPESFFKKIFQLKIQLEDADGTDFDATFIKMMKGGNKNMREQLSDTLEGETFTLHASKAKCFADGKDKGTAPEKISCVALADEVTNSAGSINATITAKLTPDADGMEWDAKKIVVTGTSFDF